MKYYSLIILTLLLLTSCVSIPKINNDFSEGNYTEIVHDAGKSGRSISEMPLSTLYFLCPSYYEVRDYSKFKECADFILQHPDPATEFYPGVAVTHVNKEEFQGYILGYKARMLLEFGEYKAALEIAQEAYSKVLKGDNDIRKDFNIISPLEVKALALVYLGRQNEVASVISRLEDAKSYMPVNASILANLRKTAIAKIYFALHDYKNARIALEEQTFDPLYSVITSLVVFVDNVSMDKNIREAAVRIPRLYMISKAYMETGEVVKARKGLDALLANPVIASMGSIHWLVLRDMAELSWGEGHKDKAIALLRQAVDVIESQRSTIQTEAYKIGFVGDKQQVYQLLINYLIKTKHVSEAFVYVEKAKARALVDILAQKQSFKAKDDKATSQDLSQLNQLDQQYQLQTVAAIKQVSRTRALILKKREQLVKQNPEVASLVSVTEVKTSALQRLLSPDELLVEYYGNSSRLYVFVASQNTIRVTEIPSDGLASKVSHFRHAILETNNDSWKNASQAVYNAIIAPVKNTLNRKKLVIVPHGSLHYLPFAALYDGHHFLLDKFSIRVLPSASVMQYLKSGTRTEIVPMLALGNPNLKNPQLDLPGAQEEVRAIGKMIPGARVAIRDQATETMLKKFADQASILHIASHGEFDPDAPLQSRLLLAGDSSNDGSLSVSELYDMKLNSELVTLSACQTGLGDVESGDDVIGLTRGFLFAGAENIVASLWVVDDRATSELMREFYKYLKYDDVEDALRKAQLMVKNKINQHPYYWAAFQLTGLGSTRVSY